MQKRSPEFLKVSFYLSKFGVSVKDQKYPLPPSRLKTTKWNEAYRIFYEKLNQERTVLSFERSLKNARDSFDSHLPNSTRVGWLAGEKIPSPLGKEAQKIFNELNIKSEQEVWEVIQIYSDLNAKNYTQVFNDIISIQENEVPYNSKKSYVTGKTEGGKKVITSTQYERSPKLRTEGIEIHGLNCMVCNFNFGEFYGDWGEGFIEVHHVQALHKNQGKKVETNPETDLAVLCANCHRMIHRKRDIALSIQELKAKILKTK